MKCKVYKVRPKAELLLRTVYGHEFVSAPLDSTLREVMEKNGFEVGYYMVSINGGLMCGSDYDRTLREIGISDDYYYTITFIPKSYNC